jgi:hypothetical protein
MAQQEVSSGNTDEKINTENFSIECKVTRYEEQDAVY